MSDKPSISWRIPLWIEQLSHQKTARTPMSSYDFIMRLKDASKTARSVDPQMRKQSPIPVASIVAIDVMRIPFFPFVTKQRSPRLLHPYTDVVATHHDDSSRQTQRYPPRIILSSVLIA